MKKTFAWCIVVYAWAGMLSRASTGDSDGTSAKADAYRASDFEVFLDRYKDMRGLKRETLCSPEKGRPVELLRIDARHYGMYRLLLTARHDAGDTAGSYVLEGMLDALLGEGDDGRWLRERTEIAVVPFVDKDGVEGGVGGKDHSSDYSEANAPAAVAAIKKFMKPGWAEYQPTIVIDVHASATERTPQHTVRIIGHDGADGKRVMRFAELLEEQHLAVDCSTVAGEGGGRIGFSEWVAQLTSVRFAARIEIDSGADPEAARASGRSLVIAVRKHLQGNKTAFDDLYSKRADLKYKISLPKGYAENPHKKWPVILWLHGAGPCYGYESVTAWGVPRYVLDTPDFPFITLIPLVPVARWEACTAALDILLDETIANYRVDSQRIYMTGHSLGGGGTWEMAMQHPERFAAVAPASGAGCFPGLENMKGMAVWAIQGDEDVPVPRKYHQETVDAFRKVGGEVKFPPMPGVGHDVYRDVYMQPELYEWFLRYTNPGLAPVPQNLEGMEMVTMEPMLVACATSPASDTWKSVEQFAADNSLLGKPQTRFFTLSGRSGGRAVTVGPDVKGNESFSIRKVFGGRYVVIDVPPRCDAGPGPMGIYRDEARAYRWLSLHGMKFPKSGTIHEFSRSPLQHVKRYVPIIEPSEEDHAQENQ